MFKKRFISIVFLLFFLSLIVVPILIGIHTMAHDPNIVAVEGTFMGWAIDTYRNHMLD